MQPYFIHLTGSMCISTLWKSSRHPCRVVTSIGINWAWGALVFRVSETESKLANNLHFYLQPDLWEKSLGWSVLKQVSEENWHSLAWGEETPPPNPDRWVFSGPAAFSSAMLWDEQGQHLTILQVTIILQCTNWKKVRLRQSTIAFCLVEEREG